MVAEKVDPSTCPHGDPFPGSASEEHSDGLDTIVHLVHKYAKKGRTDTGYKAARKFGEESPELVDTFTIAYLASAGTRTLLYDASERPFALHLAQVISAFEKRLYGSASAADVERDNLVHFFKCRIPCSCLDELAEEEPPEETQVCSWIECGACKPVAELMACAACKCAFYCDSNCQRSHWPMHAQECCVLKEKSVNRGDEETSDTELETSGQFSVYSMTSARSNKSGTSGRSGKSGKSGKSGSKSRRSSHRKRKEDAPRSPTKSPRTPLSPTRSPRSPKKLLKPPKSPRRSPRKSLTVPHSPTKSVKSLSSPSSRRKSLVKQDSKKRKARKSIALSQDKSEEKKEKKHSKSKHDKFNSSSGSLSLKKERRKSQKSSSHDDEHKERRKSKSSGSHHHHHHKDSSSEKKKSKSKKKHEETTAQ